MLREGYSRYTKRKHCITNLSHATQHACQIFIGNLDITGKLEESHFKNNSKNNAQMNRLSYDS